MTVGLLHRIRLGRYPSAHAIGPAVAVIGRSGTDRAGTRRISAPSGGGCETDGMVAREVELTALVLAILLVGCVGVAVMAGPAMGVGLGTAVTLILGSVLLPHRR